MNVFSLFNNKDLDSIKLGIQVVKSLGLQKEFEKYYERPFYDYVYHIQFFQNIYGINYNYDKLKYFYFLYFNSNIDLVRKT